MDQHPSINVQCDNRCIFIFLGFFFIESYYDLLHTYVTGNQKRAGSGMDPARDVFSQPVFVSICLYLPYVLGGFLSFLEALPVWRFFTFMGVGHFF